MRHVEPYQQHCRRLLLNPDRRVLRKHNSYFSLTGARYSLMEIASCTSAHGARATEQTAGTVMATRSRSATRLPERTASRWLAGRRSLYVGSTAAGTLKIGQSAAATCSGYTQASTGRLEVNLASSSSNGKLRVAGNASLNGTVGVNLVGGYTPVPARAGTL